MSSVVKMPIVIPGDHYKTVSESSEVRKIRVAAYCRVSTDQEEQMSSFANQVRTYKNKITANAGWEFAGIYADEGISGTDIKKRTGFQKMMADCRNGKIDRIITKSISRFARNTIDSLRYTRELKNMGISVDFEEEHLNSEDAGAEMIFTILSAVAEQESRNISEHTKWGIRSRYKQGIYKNTTVHLLGYKIDDDEKTAIDEDGAEIVRLIYSNYLEGMGYSEIAAMLNDMGAPGKQNSWHASSVQAILTNEKYKGDVLLQKTYVKDFMSHKAVKNDGQMKQYYIKDAHPAIIDAGYWDAVQQEIVRRQQIKDKNGDKILFNAHNPYCGKVFFKKNCQALLRRYAYNSGKKQCATWRCKWYKKGYYCVCHDPAVTKEQPTDKLPACFGFTVNDRIVKGFFKTAWNDMMDDNLQKKRLGWMAVTEDANAAALAKIRARQMLTMTAGGEASKLDDEIPEITKMVLDRIEIEDICHADVTFLDGTVRRVDLSNLYAAI